MALCKGDLSTADCSRSVTQDAQHVIHLDSHDSSPPTHQSPIGRFSLPVFLWIEAYSRGCSKSAQQQSSNMYSDMMTVIRHYLWKMKASLSEDLVEVREVNDSMGIDQIKLHFQECMPHSIPR